MVTRIDPVIRMEDTTVDNHDISWHLIDIFSVHNASDSSRRHHVKFDVPVPVGHGKNGFAVKTVIKDPDRDLVVHKWFAFIQFGHKKGSLKHL